MPITNFIRKDIVTTGPEENVREVANLMRDYDIGAVVVCDEARRPVGIVTDRDIVLRCVCEGDDGESTSVGDIMSTSVHTVAEDCGLMDILTEMRASGARRMPIVDADGRVTGLVSFGDVLELLTQELSALASTATPEMKKIDKRAA
jgi:CBS domain-containing protein